MSPGIPSRQSTYCSLLIPANTVQVYNRINIIKEAGARLPCPKVTDVAALSHSTSGSVVRAPESELDFLGAGKRFAQLRPMLPFHYISAVKDDRPDRPREPFQPER